MDEREITKLGEKWIIDEMKLTVSREQLMKAILGISNISLGESDCYLETIKYDEERDNWNVVIRGAE